MLYCRLLFRVLTLLSLSLHVVLFCDRYVGSHTVVELLEEEYNVVVVDNFVNSIKGDLKIYTFNYNFFKNYPFLKVRIEYWCNDDLLFQCRIDQSGRGEFFKVTIAVYSSSLMYIHFLTFITYCFFCTAHNQWWLHVKNVQSLCTLFLFLNCT